MKNNKLDLSDIKEYDLDKTSSFTDLMSRSERKAYQRAKEKITDDEKAKKQQKAILELMEDSNIDNKKRKWKKKKKTKPEIIDNLNEEENTKTTTVKHSNNNLPVKEETLGKTQLLEITKQMKLNLVEKQEENKEKRKKGISILNIIGEINLLCIGYYIYLLVFTNYQDNQNNYLITGAIIIILVLLFGFSVITNKKISKIFNILNILTIIVFIGFNAYTLLH